jgi:uncharacterized protein YbbC (DUF1343 family)
MHGASRSFFANSTPCSMKRSLVVFSALFICCLGSAVAAMGIRTGAERWAAEDFAAIAGKRVGLITNHTATVGDRHLADLLHASEAIELTALFGPEHGIRGDAPAGARIGDDVDSRTGAPVFSLYGQIRKPTPAMLENVDVLIFDIQDVGARFYTYISTMGYGMQAAAEKGIPFVVLDRPNPLGGELVEGFLLEGGNESFVGLYPIPIVHGLTVGELAKLIQGEKMLAGLEELELVVAEMEGWRRDALWSELGREWNPPSPNIPDFETALIYPGACFFEGTTASEGRGTREPFVVVGAPWVDGRKMAEELTRRGLPGLRFEPATFTPVSIPHMAMNPKFNNREVFGVRHLVTDAAKVRPVEAGVHLLDVFLAQAPDRDELFRAARIQRLAGTAKLHEMLLAGKSPREIVGDWSEEVERFRETRRPYLLY